MEQQEFLTWVTENCTDKASNSLFIVPDFSASLSLYRTGLLVSFVATIINGRVNRADFNADHYPAEYEYDALIRHLQNATDNEPAWCFYFLDQDDAWGVVNRIWQWKPDCSTMDLSLFESRPAEQSGTAHLGIVGENKAWMLLHDFHPNAYFEISFYGDETIVNELKRELNF
jgi:hypothetical protein